MMMGWCGICRYKARETWISTPHPFNHVPYDCCHGLCPHQPQLAMHATAGTTFPPVLRTITHTSPLCPCVKPTPADGESSPTPHPPPDQSEMQCTDPTGRTTAFNPPTDCACYLPHAHTTSTFHPCQKIHPWNPNPPPSFTTTIPEAKAANQHAPNALDATHMQSTSVAPKNYGMDLLHNAGTTRRDPSSIPRGWSSAQTGSNPSDVVITTAL